MKFNLLKFRTVVMLFSLLFISGLFVASFQNNISKANSFIASIIVNLPHLDFGLVFPESNHRKLLLFLTLMPEMGMEATLSLKNISHLIQLTVIIAK